MLLSPSKSSSSTMSTSTMIIIMVVIVISTTSATSWASVREQRRKRSVYENGKQLFTQSVSLVLKSTNQWQCLQKKYTGVFILEDQIGRFGDKKIEFDIWKKKVDYQGCLKALGLLLPSQLTCESSLMPGFLQWKFLKLIFFWMSKQQKSVTNMFLMTVPWTFHSNRLQQHQLENHYPATTPNPLNKICKCCINFVFVLMSFVNSYNLYFGDKPACLDVLVYWTIKRINWKINLDLVQMNQRTYTLMWASRR